MVSRRATHPAKLPFPITLSNPSSAAATVAPTSTAYSTKNKVNGKAKAAPAPLTAPDSQDSVMGSWSTLSIPKSLISGQQPALTPSSAAPLPISNLTEATPPIPPRIPDVPSPNVPTATASTVATAGPSSLPGPSSDYIPSPPSKSKSKLSGRKRPRSTPPSTPPAPRKLIPEPAPPPPSSSFLVPAREVVQRLSNSSRDRRPPPKHVSTRISTPHPYPIPSNGTKRRSRVVSGLGPVPPMPLVPIPMPRVGITEGSSDAAGVKGSGFLPARRPSPVPPSSSKSKSTRSSDSYVSLSDSHEQLAAVESHPVPPLAPPHSPITLDAPAPRTTPRRPSLTHLLASLRSPTSPRAPHLSPIPGVPRIFHPSPLNPRPPPQPSPLTANANPNPVQRSPVATRSPLVLRPGRTTHIIPLPSITYASVQPRPLALPASEAADQLWTPTQTGAEEYASDHPQDLVERAWEMEERDELERVKRWVEAVSIALAIVEGEPEEQEAEQPIGDEFWEWEKPAEIDLEKLTPRTEEKQVEIEVPIVMQVPVNDVSPTREDPPPLTTQKDVATRTPSPYPAPQPPDIHLDSSSSSSSRRVAQDHVSHHPNVPLTTRKSFMTLTSPSPFSGLPSPFRMALPTPITPLYALRGEVYPTPAAQEPLQPLFPAAVPGDTPGARNDASGRVPSALDRASSYLSSSAPSRSRSPETPPRIVHSSTERTQHQPEPQSHTRTRSRSSSRTRSPINASKGCSARPRTESDSTMSGGFTRSGRGRSPTRRSWKATSERATTRVGVGLVMEWVGGFERARVIQPVYLDSQTGDAVPSVIAEGRRAVASEEGWDMSSVSDGLEVRRPRTASRSRSQSVYSSSVVRPGSQSSIRSADLFYNHRVPPPPTPAHGDGDKNEPSHSSTPETLKAEQHHQLQETAPEAQLTAPVSSSVPRPGMSPSILRRRKSHRAPRSVVSLPHSKEREDDAKLNELEAKQPNPVIPSSLKAKPTLPSTNLPISLSSPISHREVPTLVRHHVIPSPASAPAAETSNLAFLKFMTLLQQFNSDLSSDRRGVPRWKHDFAEAEEKVRIAYDAFKAAIERSKVDFRPWLREGERTRGDRDDEDEEGRPVMYVEDVWEKMVLGSHANRGSASTRAVQEDIIRSVVSTWDYLASECLNDVRDVLEQLVTSIVDLHFGCAGDGNELRMIVQSIADTQLHSACDVTSGKLAELAMLESTYVFTASETRFHHSASAILAQYKEVRHHADSSILGRAVASQSPAPLAMSEDPNIPLTFKTRTHSAFVQTQSHSQSRESQAMSIPLSSTTKAASLFSKGPSLSTNPTVAEDMPVNSDVKAGLRQQLVQQQQLRADSLRSVNDAVQVALTNLRNLGLGDLATPEKLYEKFLEPDPVDEVLEVMANVEAYVDAASSRFIDYATLHLEHHLVNSIGDKIFTTVLERLDLGGAEIKNRCLQWMSGSGQ